MVPAILGQIIGGVGSLVGGIIGGNKASKSADRAAQLQYQAAQEGIAESARQFDLTRGDFASEQQAGEDALIGLRALTGLDGDEAQLAEIEALRASPLYQSLYRTGEEATLQNASATGGLRGGNTQRALYELGEDTLSDVIRTQLSDYAGIVGIGTGADSAIGSFGANAVAQQNAQRNFGTAAQAQAQLVRGGVNSQNFQNAGNLFGQVLQGIKF